MKNEEQILVNTQKILTILEGRADYKTNNAGVMDVFSNTDGNPSTVPFPDGDAFDDWWKPLFDAPMGTVVLLGEGGKYGTLTHAIQFNMPVQEWRYDHLKDSPELLGLAADIRLMAKNHYPMFNWVLTEMFGNDWKTRYSMPDQAGMTSFWTGLPYDLFKCGVRAVNGLNDTAPKTADE